MNFYDYYIIGFFSIAYFLWIFVHSYFSKKCNYDCSKCKLWDCSGYHCSKKRSEFNKK